MGKDSNIVHQYFKKVLPDVTLLIKVNPILLKATEITVFKDKGPDLRDIDVDAKIFDDLEADGFIGASPLEFNLYMSGLIK